jgi:hypothetical protein
MTVQELIDLLRQQPPDHVVMVEGYETGWDTLVSVEASGMAPQRPCNAWDGEFERAGESDARAVAGVLLTGKRGHLRAR